MEPLKRSYTKLPLTEKQKSQIEGIARVYDDDFRLPVYTYGSDGRRVLIVTDKIMPDDDNAGELFAGRERGVYEKVLAYCFDQKDKDAEIEKICLFNFEAARPDVSPKKNSEDCRRTAECNQVFYQRLKYFIKKYRPDTVICAGLEPFGLMFRDLVDSDPKRIVKNRFNRIYNVRIEDHKFQFMGMIDIARAVSWDSKNKEFANLLTYIADGIIQAFNGYNYFDIKLPKTEMVYIDTIKKFKRFYADLNEATLCAIDSEGDGRGRLRSKLYSLQFAWEVDKGYFLPLDHPDTPFTPEEIKYIKRKLKYYFEFGKSKYHIYQYGKYDIGQIYAQLGIRFYNHRIYDIQGGRFLWNENLPKLKAYGIKPYGLEFISMQHGCTIYEEIEFSKGDRGNIASEGLTTRFIEYSIYDATVMVAIHNEQIARAKKERHSKFLKYNCEQISDTLIALAQMEFTGALVDRKQIYHLKSRDGPVYKSIKGQLEKFKDSKKAQKVNAYLLKKQGISQGGMFGGNSWVFDINKEETQDLLFYKSLGLTPLDVKKSGKGKIDKAFLKQYADEVPEVKLFKDYKAACTLRNNFVNKMFDKLHNDLDTIADGRLRSSYTYTQTTTNRLSSVNLNLQNLVARGDWSKPLKKSFVSPRRCLLVKNDYSAQEVRDWCNQAGDELLADAFYQGLKIRQELRILAYANPENWEAWLAFKKRVQWDDKNKWKEEVKKTGATIYNLKTDLIKQINDPVTKELGSLSLTLEVAGDVHKLNCARFFGVDVLDVTDDQRYDIKAVVFGTIYGKTAAGLAKSKAEGGLGKTEEECQAIIDKLFVEFKTGGDWLKEQYEFGQENLWVESPLGMRRHLSGYLHTRPAIINAMNRRGPNCVDVKTQCLTEQGWKYYNQLKVGDLIYTKNAETGNLELQPIKELTVSNYKGYMFKIKGGIDALTTPNHRWLIDYGKGKYKRTKMVDSEYLARSKNNNPIHLTAARPFEQKGNGTWSNDEVRLIGWVLTDGCYEKDRPNCISIKQSIIGNPHKVEIIDGIIERLNVDFGRSGPDNTGGIKWKVSKALGIKIRAALPNKILNSKFINSLSTEQLQILYDNMLLGNGALITKTNRYDSFGAGTKQKALEFSRLCVLLGVSHSIESSEPYVAKKQYDSMPNIPQQTQKFWYVRFKQRDRAQAMFGSKWVKYDNKVWCPTVDNGTFIARRGSSVYVTGNSKIQGNSSQIGTASIRIMQKLFWHYWTKHDIDVYWKSVTNDVHDAVESETPITFSPIYLYMMEHASTTLIHRRFEKVFDFKMTVGLEIEFNIGPAMHDVGLWGFDHVSLQENIVNTIDYHEKELGYRYKKGEGQQMIDDALHNWGIIRDFRLRELEEDVKTKKPAKTMLLTEENARSSGLIIEGHKHRPQAY